MKICVFGLWHLGSVTAACLANAGHTVTGLDPNEDVITALQDTGTPPIYEPGLQALIQKGIAERRLSFTTELQATANVDVVWVTFDTPVDNNDVADNAFVRNHVKSIFPYLTADTVVVISSQLPVGSTTGLQDAFLAEQATQNVYFVYSPENLRLGNAIRVFTNPDRIVVGLDHPAARPIIEALLHPITEQIEFMAIASAEMTKHAINAFLATSVTFINEIASICEKVGANAQEVERGLKSEARIGPRAYLGPGGAFAGGTLARDIEFLGQLAQTYALPTQVLKSVPTSNHLHKQWPLRRLQDLVSDLGGATVTILGLTYKPGTDTLRRSLSIELIEALVAHNVTVKAFDPQVSELPENLQNVTLTSTLQDALIGADATVLMTPWPDFKTLTTSDFINLTKTPLLLDANRFLAETFDNNSAITYSSVGKSL